MKAVMVVECDEADEYIQRFVDEVQKIADKKLYFEANLELTTFKEWDD